MYKFKQIKNGHRTKSFEDHTTIAYCMLWLNNDCPDWLVPDKNPIKELISSLLLLMTGISALIGSITFLMIVNVPFYGKLIGIGLSLFGVIYLLLEFSLEYYNYFVLLHQPKKIAWDSKCLYLWTRQNYIILIPWDRVVKLEEKQYGSEPYWMFYILRPKAIYPKKFFIDLGYVAGLKIKEHMEKLK